MPPETSLHSNRDLPLLGQLIFIELIYPPGDIKDYTLSLAFTARYGSTYISAHCLKKYFHLQFQLNDLLLDPVVLYTAHWSAAPPGGEKTQFFRIHSSIELYTSFESINIPEHKNLF